MSFTFWVVRRMLAHAWSPVDAHCINTRPASKTQKPGNGPGIVETLWRETWKQPKWFLALGFPKIIRTKQNAVHGVNSAGYWLPG
jgi:hypothetical protein